MVSLSTCTGKNPYQRQDSIKWKPTNPLKMLPCWNNHAKSWRVIQANCVQEESRHKLKNYRYYCGNYITTTKYSLFTFIPLNIFHQLTTKYATVYFIFLAVLNFCPEFATYKKYMALIPPSIVIGTTMLKDAFEDIRRWRSDNEINNRSCFVWNKDTSSFLKSSWKHVIVGDIIMVRDCHDIPADLLILRTSDRSGSCFVETSNLDGETSLKQCSVPLRYLPFSEKETQFDPWLFSGILNCEQPVNSIYRVRAHLDFGNGATEVLNKNNILLRGSKLKNTDYVEGLVMYAGHDTKVMMNNGRAPLKVSAIERKTNGFILVCLVILVAMITSSCILGSMFLADELDPMAPFVPSNSPNPLKAGILGIGKFVLCYQVIVPISLYITVEVIKLAQVFFMSQDLDLYDEENDYPINCRSLNIPEELGQITHILSDKTGTLTENVMLFRNCALDDEDYACDPEHSTPGNNIISNKLWKRAMNYEDDDDVNHFFRNILVNNTVVVNKNYEERELESVQSYSQDQSSSGRSVFEQATGFVVNTESGMEVYMEDSTSLTPLQSSFHRCSSLIKGAFYDAREAIREYWETGTLGSSSSSEDFAKETKYHAESPDELALVEGAEMYGFCLEERTPTGVIIRNPDNSRERIDVKLVLPFDSKRKRMSVIVEENGKFIMYTKGADSAVLNRLTAKCDSLKNKLSLRIHEYSCRGLRTLCFAMRAISGEELGFIYENYRKIMMDSTGDRDTRISQLGDQAEYDLTLIGVTGIEDKLQEDVDTTITSLRQAGIQVWVLTGDKLETAENIARSSGLFDEETTVFRINHINDVMEVTRTMHYNVVLSTEALKHIEDGDSSLIELLKGATSVLCYRMTPAEKASVVTTVKHHLKGKILAVGDGANDVPMIQAAHVGIGMKGKEGMQAAMACDFAIGKFCFLRKLLLVHGHWCYERLSLLFLYFLYKNTNNVFILFFFQFFCGVSGTYYVDSTYSLLYPIIFTGLQPILVGVLDQDKRAQELMWNPKLYSAGRIGSSYTYLLFLYNVLDGVWQAAVIFFIPQMTIRESETGMWTLGFYVGTAMMFANCAHLCIEIRYWNFVISICLVFFMFLHFAFFTAFYPLAWDAMRLASFWYSTFIVLFVSVLPRFFIRVINHSDLFSFSR